MRAIIYCGRELYAIPLLRASLAPVLKVVFKMRLRRQVRNPELRAKLTPDYSPGCKRILVSNDYFPAITKANVEVIPGGVGRIQGDTIVSKDGTERKADVIVFGTGFQVTDVSIARNIYGRNGRTLAAHWSRGMQALRGTSIAGFPNFFFMLGPNTGLGHTSLVFMAEAQAKYIVQALEYLDRSGKNFCEAKRKAEDTWTHQVQKRMKRTVWLSGGCSSWYLDSQGRNTTLWPDFTFRFRKALATFDPSEYRFSKK
jgi:cation diffusion facilitator CzcD-associated flavoprotein CzcO